MYSDLMAMTTMMRVMVRIVMTMSLNLKPNASHVCLHKGNRKKWSGTMAAAAEVVYQEAANGSKQPDNNGTMATRGALSGANGLFVGLTVGVTI
jgi:hypothetical protein